MFKLLKKLTKKEVFYAIVCIILVSVHVWLELKVPDYMSSITQLVQTKGSTMAQILEQGAYMMGCALLSLICNIVVGYLAARVASSFSATLRHKIFEKVQSERLRRSNIEITPDGKKRKTHKYSSKKPNIDRIFDDE